MKINKAFISLGLMGMLVIPSISLAAESNTNGKNRSLKRYEMGAIVDRNEIVNQWKAYLNSLKTRFGQWKQNVN